MLDRPTGIATDCEFAFPQGNFSVNVRQLDADVLAYALLVAEGSHIIVSAERISADDLPLVLHLVKIADRLTHGIGKLSQVRRERSRIELREVHAALLARGYGVLAGAMDRAVVRLAEHGIQTAYSRIIGVVIHDTGAATATLLLPEGEVLGKDRNHMAPARAVEIAE